MFNKRKNIIMVIIALSLLLSLSFVFADGEEPPVRDWSDINTQYILKSNVIEFDDINDDFIIDSENSYLYPIAEHTQYELGQVLLDWKTKKSYKILSIEADAEQNIFYTYAKAGLTEVFEDFSISEGTYKLTAENISELTGLSANSILKTQISEVASENGDVIRIFFRKNSHDSDYEINSSPDDEDCSDLEFDGSIDLVRPRITIEYSLINQKYDVRFSVDEVLTATINGKKTVDFIKPEEDTIFQFVIPLEIASIEFTLDMKYGASGSADIQVAVNQSVTLNVGVRGDLTVVVPTSAEGYFNYTNLVYNATGSARASANAYVQAVPKISFSILDIEIGSVEGTIGAKGRLATGAFIVDGGTDIRFRVFFDIYGYVNAKANIFGSEHVLYENKWTLVHKETAKTLSSFWQEVNDGSLSIPDPVPPSISFTADGIAENSNTITYIVNGRANSENIGDFHLYVNDPDVVNPEDKLTRVQIARVRAGQADEIIKNYYISDFSFTQTEDIYNLMKPQSPYQAFEKIQTFKVVAYQGQRAYSSRQITVEIIEDNGPYFTFMPFNIEPVLSDPNSQWGDYTEPTSVYNCPYQISEIENADKIPKFLLKVSDIDGLDMDKIVKLEIIKLPEEPWQNGTLVGEYNFAGDQQKTNIKLEIPTAQCMGNNTNAKFVIRSTNKGGKVYTSAPVRAIWNVIDTEPWTRLTLTDVPNAATYEGQTLTYIGSTDYVKNANPKFHIEVEGNKIINMLQLVDLNDNVIWSKDISLLNTTQYTYDVNLLPIIQSYNMYRVKTITRDGMGYYSRHIKINWLSWSYYGSTAPIRVSGYPSNMDNVTVYSDENPCFEINYTWWGGTTPKVSKIYIKTSTNQILETLNINGQSSVNFSVGIEGLMGQNNVRTFYTEYVYENSAGSYKSANTTINFVRKYEPSISFKPFGLDAADGIAAYTSNYLPAQMPADLRPSFQISIMDIDTVAKDAIQRIELVTADNIIVKSVDIGNQNVNSITVNWDTLECMNETLDNTFFVRVIDKECRVYNSELIRAVWNCTNTVAISFTADGHEAGSTITIQGSAEDIAQTGAGKFNINIQETDSDESFNITQINIVKADGEIAKTLNVNSRSINTQVNITECMEAGTTESFYLVVQNAAGQEFTTDSITVNWIADRRPAINFSIYGAGEGSTAYIPEESLPGKAPKISISVTDSDNTDSDIISKVEILTANGVVLKTFNVLAQNSRSVSINEEAVQYVDQGNNYFYVRVTNKGGKVYTTGGIYVYYGDLSEDDYQ